MQALVDQNTTLTANLHVINGNKYKIFTHFLVEIKINKV